MVQPDSINNVTVVIRSIGERTEEVCRRLLLEQGITEDAIFTTREAPLSQAIRSGFLIGLEKGLPWTFCVDADVLLRPGSVKRMLQLAEEQPENVCEIQGYVLDKFFGGARTAGNHMYRTAHLDRLLSAIPDEGVDIRPEYYTLKSMKEIGLPYVLVPELLGLHDFEQFYKDIFRTCFVQAHKHIEFTELLLTIWRAGAATDADYIAALAGFARGVEHRERVHVDVRSDIFRFESDAIGLEEKSPMILTDWSLDQVEKIITDWKDHECYSSKYQRRLGYQKPESIQLTRLSRLQRSFSEKGVLPTFLYATGWLMKFIGQRIQTLATRF